MLKDSLQVKKMLRYAEFALKADNFLKTEPVVIKGLKKILRYQSLYLYFRKSGESPGYELCGRQFRVFQSTGLI